MAEVLLSENSVPLAGLSQLYRDPYKLVLDKKLQQSVKKAHSIVADAAKGNAAVYGVNTGFGKLAQTRISATDLATLQRNLILSHASGVGDLMPVTLTRLMMALKLISLTRGASGVSWDLILLLTNMLEKQVTPCVPAQGSVGASGDLAPLAHMAATMIGEGDAWYREEKLPAAQALQKAGLAPITLGPKEGLALINGTQFSTAYALAAWFDTWDIACAAIVTGALSTDAAMGSPAPFRAEIQSLRGHSGQIDVARTLRTLLEGSIIRETHREDDERVQDPYCLRCQPQVMGACFGLLRHVACVLETEANAVTDNPLVLTQTGEILSGGNFHAEPVAFAADQLALAIAEIGSIAQRRIAMLVDPAMSFGLPAFLSPSPGVNSGFMIAEVTSAALMSENKQKAAPCSVDSTPTSANQEDHVSMAAHAARRLTGMNDNLAHIIGIEWLIAAQGVELRAPLTTSPALQNTINALRLRVPGLKEDRLMAPDIATATTALRQGTLIKSVPAEIFPSPETPT
ncbi:histidine ammonia-lyase [Parvularcula sp. IMCC14364]|uniref:histidine ammonia-lyase n=1 Tax=Parvularcula sp. IMCC14364 TaxID=3067902 RepID=UPI002740F25F|nr:histidine ammonia-lyase [Parvularcula sp. IMCC14364]